ncbi:MAG TPA: tyrosine recombinase XerD [Ktedonobacter sp.]|nr:tyrosine recombinase XerD [Ktedonobacter sp.]
MFLEQRGIVQWEQVTRERIADHVCVMRDTYGYRPTTIARKLAAYKSFFRHLRQKGIMSEDVVGHVETPHVEKEPPQFLTLEQIQHLFEQVDTTTLAGLRDMAMLHLLSATGMRTSEIVSLNLNDICLQEEGEESVVYVGRVHDEQAEHAGRERTLPLTATVVDALSHYIRDGRPRLARTPVEQSLFLNHHGERLTRQGFWLIIKGYARAAHVEALTPHMLRHSFAMLMLQEGKELRSVQELLGHAHISTTQVYNQFAHIGGRDL